MKNYKEYATVVALKNGTFGIYCNPEGWFYEKGIRTREEAEKKCARFNDRSGGL